MRLRVKMILGVVMLLALIFGICDSILISASFTATLNAKRDTALRTYGSVQSTLELANSISAQADYGDIVDALSKLASRGHELWDGVLLQSEDGDLYRSGTTRGDAETQLGKCTVLFFESEGRKLLQVSGAMSANTRKLSLHMTRDITELYELRDAQVRTYRYLFILTVALGALGSFVLSVFLTRPVTRLTRAARKIASGDLTGRAAVHSGDELEDLAGEFNAMAERLEANIEELQEHARRHTEFMGSFAHELKSPMTSIIGYADLLRRRMLSEDEAQEAANYIFTEGRRLESLSLKLLDLLLLKKRDFELVPASPEAIVASVVRVMKPQLSRAGVSLGYRAAPGKCLLEPDLVKSLLINLVDNARKAMDADGAVFILSEMTPEGCRISVTDNGRGIPAEELERITEAFYRVDKSRSRAQGGAGLGLALCDEIAKLHGGELQIRSAVGRGTVITALLKGGIPHET